MKLYWRPVSITDRWSLEEGGSLPATQTAGKKAERTTYLH